DKFRTAYYDVPKPAADGGEGTEGIYGWTFGVEVHANALQNLLDAEYLRRLGTGWTLLLLILAGGVTGIFVFWRGAGWGMATGLLTGLVVTAIAFWGYAGEIFLPLLGTIASLDTRFIWIPMVAPVLTIVLSYVGSTAYVAIVEGREKRFIRGAFGKYVSPAVVEQISDEPEALRLGGQKRPLSVLFSDLAGFTDLSEMLDAEDLITLLNDYLSEMTDLVLQEGGTLDKYIGDAIMAFWNAPQDQEDHADRALRCAVLMQRKMDELNERWATENEDTEPLTVRIGVNTGVVVVGNVGGKDRFDYSAIGDAVNLAARLEPANKTYGTLTMASEYTLREAVASNYQLRELDLMTVKGKTEPVRVYELLELADGELPKEKQEALGQYNLGLDAYQRRDWELAREYFAAAVEADPSDEPSKLYISRAQECIENPPAEDWDFVVKRTEK
ncbi:adenylate/guanylate cyclase domain-containing protein, partial [Gemmatimonadota bacterium]